MLHLATWNLPDFLLCLESKTEPSVAISQQKLFLANIDTGKEELKKAGQDDQEEPEYIDDCDTTGSVLSDPVSLLF